MKKAKYIFIAALCAAAMLSACGSSADTSGQAELESLKAENEALRAEIAETTMSEVVTSSETSSVEIAEETAAETKTEIETETTTAATAEDGTAVYDGCSLKINGATLVTDYKDEPAIVLEMQFKNDSEEAASCGFTFRTDVYQEGIECDTAILFGDVADKYDTSTYITDIKPGVEITVYKAYKLRNETSDVNVEVGGLYDFSKEILLEHTFTF
ncbi:MAG: DUF5067 domain-containing protein [Huintestinicola sp.]|uniref:DUF5067 domain-containing protein n=1 Tax=Huintestinicola sp. TaxID=2981661 RepID=UPI003F0C9738